jgi:hypothetical protein
MASYSFEKLTKADLVIDAIYESNRFDPTSSYGSEPLHHLIPGIGNAGGFRKRATHNKDRIVALVLTSTGSEIDWPDFLNPFTGVYTYYGDNRRPGKDLHATKAKGNVELARMFELAHGDAESRANCPLILVFESGGIGRDMVFKGLAVPGASHLQSGEDLIAIWRMSNGQRFQNYKAQFTILDTGTISGEWIREVFSKRYFDVEDLRVPKALYEWIYFGKYIPLVAEREKKARTIEEQIAKPGLAADLVQHIYKYCQADPFLFEPIAAAIWQLSCSQPVEYELTRRFKDGGRDAVGHLLLGPISDVVKLSFSLEAKCYRPLKNRVGVKEMSRLISRLKHREFGVLVTTSAVDKQAYEEIRSDGHPIVVLAGQDIANVLISSGINTLPKLDKWIHSGKL